MNVLIIDDNDLACVAMKAVLQPLDCDVRIAHTHGDALEQIGWADVVVLDYEMPGVTECNFITLAEQINKPVIAHTGYPLESLPQLPKRVRYAAKDENYQSLVNAISELEI